MTKLRVTVWSEVIDPVLEPRAVTYYPDDINVYLAEFLSIEHDFEVRTANLRQKENGLSQEILNDTDVLVWWSHLYDDQVSDETAQRVAETVLNGMGILFLHASLGSKPAKILLGTNSNTGKYREIGEKEKIWVVDRSHPVVDGMEKEYIEIPASEMYGEPYGIPTPDDIVFISWFEGGEVLRSGVDWKKGAGKVFFFAPGHEEFPVYYHSEIQKAVKNIVRWLKPVKGPEITFQGEVESLEIIKNPVKKEK